MAAKKVAAKKAPAKKKPPADMFVVDWEGDYPDKVVSVEGTVYSSLDEIVGEAGGGGGPFTVYRLTKVGTFEVEEEIKYTFKEVK